MAKTSRPPHSGDNLLPDGKEDVLVCEQPPGNSGKQDIMSDSLTFP